MKRKKNQRVALILAILFGFIGIHRFYLRKIKSGILYLLFSWTFIPTLFTIFDIIGLAFKSKEKFDKKYNQAS